MAKKSSNGLDLKKCQQAAEVCACFNFRKASRAVTQLYDETLSPSGLRSTQLVILTSVVVSESPSVVKLARGMVMDRSTLARNLKPLEKQKLLKVVPGKDRRTRVVSLTSRGRDTLRKALPLWEQAQKRFVKQLGARRWRETLSHLELAVEASHASL